MATASARINELILLHLRSKKGSTAEGHNLTSVMWQDLYEHVTAGYSLTSASTWVMDNPNLPFRILWDVFENYIKSEAARQREGKDEPR